MGRRTLGRALAHGDGASGALRAMLRVGTGRDLPSGRNPTGSDVRSPQPTRSARRYRRLGQAADEGEVRHVTKLRDRLAVLGQPIVVVLWAGDILRHMDDVPVIRFDEIDGEFTVVQPCHHNREFVVNVDRADKPDTSTTVERGPITVGDFLTEPETPTRKITILPRDLKAWMLNDFPANRAERRAGQRRWRRP